MKVVVNKLANTNLGAQSILCPHCGHQGMFEQLGQDIVVNSDGWSVGHRKCPNRKCNGLVYIIIQGGQLQKSYPPVRVDYDPEKIPEGVSKTFEEALDCHSDGSYIASAIMVRRTLEEICYDRGAKGKTLKDRITALQSKIVLPAELMEGLDELRLLGNDAAHLEAREYEEIADEELDVAIEFTKEILKGLYQYSSLLEKIRALKKSKSS